MKNIFKVLSIALLGLSFTACVEDIDTPARGEQGNPEKEVAGTYNGTWTVTYQEGENKTEYSVPGTITLSPKGEQAYAAMLNVKCAVAERPSLDIDLTSATNVTPLTSASAYLLFNAVTPNGFTKTIETEANVKGDYSTTFTGQIVPRNGEGDAVKVDPAYLDADLDFTYNYQKTVIVNRRPRKLDCKEIYHFDGTLNK